MHILKNVDTLGDNAFGLVNTQCGVLQNQYLAQQGICGPDGMQLLGAGGGMELLGAPSPGGRPGDVFMPYLLPMNVGPTDLGFILPEAVAQLNDFGEESGAGVEFLFVVLQAAVTGGLTAGMFALSGARSHWKPAALASGVSLVGGLLVMLIARSSATKA